MHAGRDRATDESGISDHISFDDPDSHDGRSRLECGECTIKVPKI